MKKLIESAGRGAAKHGKQILVTVSRDLAAGHEVVLPGNDEPIETSFAEVVRLIEQARQRAYQAVDSELVGLYWRIGQYISAKLAATVWGEGVVDRLAQHLARTVPGQRGFTRRNLFRMRQFYEANSAAGERVTALLTQLPWTRDVIVLTKLGRPESQTSDQCRPDFIGGNAAKRHSVLASLYLYAQCWHR